VDRASGRPGLPCSAQWVKLALVERAIVAAPRRTRLTASQVRPQCPRPSRGLIIAAVCIGAGFSARQPADSQVQITGRTAQWASRMRPYYIRKYIFPWAIDAAAAHYRPAADGPPLH